MDPVHFHLFIWILCLLVVEGRSNFSDDDSSIKDCRRCLPGHYASRNCSNVHDTICSPCPKGMFTSEENIANQCNVCSNCKVDEYENKVCSNYKDTECKSCDDFLIDKANERFLSGCSKYLGLKSNNSSPELYVGQSEIEKDSLEGSGVEGEREMTPTHDTVHLFNDTELVLSNTTEEGSGDMLIVFPSITETNLSSSLPTLSPEERENEDLIPITQKTVTIAQKENDIYVMTSSTARSTSQVKIQQEVVVVLNTSHEKSIQLPNITTTTESPSSDRKTTSRRLMQPGNGKGVLPEDLRKGGQPLIDKPVADASQNQESKSGEGKNVAVEVVVVIAVVAALVFFIIGFVVSKYCRRDHGTFNVLKAAKRNGLPSQDSAIEYKDPENNSGRVTSIYDEIPAVEKQNGKTTEKQPPQAIAADNVYSKPVKRTEQKPESEAKVEPSGAKEEDNPEMEPLTEIQFIDETSDDELERASQMDKLLPPVVNSSGSSSASGNQPMEDDTEETPMLNKSKAKQPGSPAHEGQKNQNT